MAIPTLGTMIAAVGSPAEWGPVSTSKIYWDDVNGSLGVEGKGLLKFVGAPTAQPTVAPAIEFSIYIYQPYHMPWVEGTLETYASEGYTANLSNDNDWRSGCDSSQALGLKAVASASVLDCSSMTNAYTLIYLDEKIASVKDHPALLCYRGYDEPGASVFTQLGEMVAFVRARDPNHYYWINLYSMYAPPSHLGGYVRVKTTEFSSVGGKLTITSDTSDWINNDFVVYTVGPGTTALSALTVNTTYYIRNKASRTSKTFELSLAEDGESISFTNDGSGTDHLFSYAMPGADATERYNNYISRYITAVQPDLFSYDYYPYKNVGGDLLANYFLNLSLVRTATKLAGIPFVQVVQTYSSQGQPTEPPTPGGGENMRLPTDSEVRFQVYASLTYGARGVHYFKRWTYAGEEGNIDDGPYLNFVKRPLTYCLQQLNSELAYLGPELSKWESIAVYHTGTLPTGCDAIPANCLFQVTGDNFCVGLFGLDGVTSAFMIMNKDCVTARETTITIPHGYYFEEFDHLTNAWLPIIPLEHSLSITLAPGDGRLFKMVFLSNALLSDCSVGIGENNPQGTLHVASGPASNDLILNQAATTNLVTNPSFEIGVTGWGDAGTHVATRITTDSVFGGACLEVVNTTQELTGFNNSFESVVGLPNILDFLSAGNHNGERITTDSTAGIACAEITATGSGASGKNFGLNLTLDNNTPYLISFYAKSISGSNQLHLEPWGTNDLPTITLTSSWVKYTVRWTTNTIYNLHNFIYWWLLDVEGEGVFRLDDIHIMKAGGGSNSASYNLTLDNSTPYTLSFYAKSTSGSNQLQVTPWGTNDLPLITLTPDWVRYTVTWTTHDQYYGQHVVYWWLNEPGTFRLDGVQVEKLSSVTPYCDGTFGPGYAWTGTPHASTSTRAAGASFFHQTINCGGGIGTAGDLLVGGTATVASIKLPTGSAVNKILTSAADGTGSWKTLTDVGVAGTHLIDGLFHIAEGLTSGHFLKATAQNAFSFAAHGLTYSDVGAEASGVVATHAALITGVHGLVFTAGKTLTMTESLTLNALPVGGLSVATAANTLGSLDVGLTTQVLIGGGAGTVPAWGTDIPTAVTIGSGYIYRASGTDVAVADGGTNLSSYAIGDILYASAATTIGKLAVGTVGKILRAGATIPAWSTLTIPDTAAIGTILHASAANVISALGAGGAGTLLMGAGAAAPAWTTPTWPNAATTTGAYLRADGTNFIQSTLVLPNAAVKGAILYGSATNVISALAAGTAGYMLETTGAAGSETPGWVLCTGTGAPVRAGSPTFTTKITTPAIEITDGGTIGLGAGKGLIQFDDETTDSISFSNCNIGIGITDLKAWHAGYGAIEFYNSAIMFGRSSTVLNFISNGYYNGAGAWKKKADGVGIAIGFGAGTFAIYPNLTSTADSDFLLTTVALNVANSGGVSIGDATDPGDNNFYVVGTAKVAGAFGCNNVTPQTKATLLADATDAASALTRINAIIDILQNYGLMNT